MPTLGAGVVTINGDSGRTIRGLRIITGSVQLGGTNPTVVDLSAHGVAILGAVVSIRSAVALADDPTSVSCSPDASVPTTLNVYAGANDTVTGTTDPTQVDSTNDAAIIDFIAVMKVI